MPIKIFADGVGNDLFTTVENAAHACVGSKLSYTEHIQMVKTLAKRARSRPQVNDHGLEGNVREATTKHTATVLPFQSIYIGGRFGFCYETGHEGGGLFEGVCSFAG